MDHPQSSVTELDDLIIQVCAGNIDAFAPVVQHFQDMAVGYGYAILHDWQLAEDAAQEAFINAYLDLANLREPKAFPGWFRRIVFKQIDRIKRKRRPLASLDQLSPMSDTHLEPSANFQRKESQDEVLRAIHALPPEQCEVVTLYYINEYSYKEISAFLDLPSSTVKMRLYHARQRLKEQLLTRIAANLSDNRPSSSRNFKERIMSFQVQTKSIPTQQVLSISRHATQKDLQALLDGGIKTLIVYAQSEGKHGQAQEAEIAGLPFAIYHKRNSAEELQIEICLPVKGRIEATKEIAVKQLPSTAVAFTSTTLRQSVFPGVLKAYEAIEEWFSATNHQPADPPREHYLNYDHSIFSAAAKWEDPCLEIAWPYQP